MNKRCSACKRLSWPATESAVYGNSVDQTVQEVAMVSPLGVTQVSRLCPGCVKILLEAGWRQDAA